MDRHIRCLSCKNPIAVDRRYPRFYVENGALGFWIRSYKCFRSVSYERMKERMKVKNELLSQCIINRIEEAELFTKRFGTFSKSDYEILMFTIFQDAIEGNLRDYDISIALGITESKVRSLRVKSQLMYPKEIKWVEELAEALSRGYFDSEQGLITITLENPSARNYIRNIIEEKCGIVNLSFNTKQLILTVESYLILAALAESQPDEIIKQLQEKWSGISSTDIKKNFSKKRVLSSISTVKNVVESCQAIYTLGLPIVNALINILM